MIDGLNTRTCLALLALVVSVLAFVLIAAWMLVTISHPTLRPTWLLVALGGSAIAAIISWWATLTR